jgi:molecular chaperone GrpE
VLDACDAAIGQGVPEIEPVRSSLTLALEKEGLEAMTAVGELFDPNLHEAVLHEAGDGTESVVVDELRAGYRWRGRVLRPAMVKVRG